MGGLMDEQTHATCRLLHAEPQLSRAENEGIRRFSGRALQIKVVLAHCKEKKELRCLTLGTE